MYNVLLLNIDIFVIRNRCLFTSFLGWHFSALSSPKRELNTTCEWAAFERQDSHHPFHRDRDWITQTQLTDAHLSHIFTSGAYVTMNVSSITALPAEIRKTDNRERAMTDSTTGSFAAYFNQDNERELLLQTPMEVERPMSIVSSVSRDDQEVPTERQVQVAQWQATDALDALRQLLEGILIITRQMKSIHNDFQGEEPQFEQECQSWSDSCSIQSCTSDDERRLSDLSRQLEGDLGAGLMGLSHAAQMLGESSRMASDEASFLMRDVRVAQGTCEEAQKRASKAESAVKILYKKQKALTSELEKSKHERNVLKRQVKALLKEKSVLKEQTEAVRVLELHVVSALQAHELALQQSKRDAEPTEDVSPNIATVRLECTPQDETTFGNVAPEYDEQHFVVSSETTESKVRVASPNCETFVEIAKEKSAKETDTGTVAKEQAPVSATETQEKLGRVGFGGAIGFAGPFGVKKPAWLSKQKSQPKLTAVRKKTIDVTHEAEQDRESVLITQRNSVDELEVHGVDASSQEAVITDECSRDTTMSPANLSIVSDNTMSSFATSNHPASVTPSPTDRSTLMKSFFRGGDKPKGTVKKPLLHLDEDSVDPAERSHDCISTSESAPSFESTSVANTPTCGAPPPKSLACDTNAPVSPFLHDFAFSQASPTDVLDDRVFRSLAIPLMVDTPMKIVKPIPVLSPYCPPEIAQIYAEMGQLHEC